jgi:hypothetical protein
MGILSKKDTTDGSKSIDRKEVKFSKETKEIDGSSSRILKED